MTISENINKYIQDSLINGKTCRFQKKEIYIYITNISAPIPDYQKNEYIYLVNKAISIWNQFDYFKFIITKSQQNADITVIWTKVGRTFEGMCKFKSIIASEIRSVTIEIGLPNICSPKNTDNSTILHTILHELGHATGLGHGCEENDIMFVPHKKTLCCLSENDAYMLKLLYSNPIGTHFNQLIR